MSEEFMFILLWLFSVLISSVSQILLKIAANHHYENRLREYLNVYVIGAYSIFLLSSVLTLLALRHVPYSRSPIIESMSYIFIPIMSYLILKEKVSRRRILSIALILVGVVIFASGRG